MRHRVQRALLTLEVDGWVQSSALQGEWVDAQRGSQRIILHYQYYEGLPTS